MKLNVIVTFRMDNIFRAAAQVDRSGGAMPMLYRTRSCLQSRTIGCHCCTMRLSTGKEACPKHRRHARDPSNFITPVAFQGRPGGRGSTGRVAPIGICSAASFLDLKNERLRPYQSDGSWLPIRVAYPRRSQPGPRARQIFVFGTRVQRSQDTKIEITKECVGRSVGRHHSHSRLFQLLEHR